MDTTTLPITHIEGIGPGRKTVLDEAGVHYVCDLLLTPPPTLSSVTGIPIKSIEHWRTAALFLELDSMNAQWAEALVHERVYDLEHLGEISLEELRALFARAVGTNLINEGPDTETLASIKVEATRHHYSAQVQGIVMDESESPIEGVQITCGFREILTNAKGFWKMTGLSFTGNPSILAKKEGHITHYTERAPLDVDVWSMDLLHIQMDRGVSEPITWDEYNGDQLPPLVSYKVKQIILGIEKVRTRDILKITETYKNGDIKLISIFRSMTDNQLNIHCYRISPEVFLEDPEMGTLWCRQNTRLKPLGLGEESILVLKKLHNKPRPTYDPSAPWTQIFES